MAHSLPSGAAALTLDQLIALNDEIAALVRTGVPLQHALGQLGEDMPGRLGLLTRRMAERIERGESLTQVLEQHAEEFPPVYRAVVVAGARSGRLSAALETVSRSARRLSETQRMVTAGLLYPFLLVLVAWGLFVLFATQISPPLAGFLEEREVLGRGLLTHLAGWGESAGLWGPLGAAAIVLAAVVWYFGSRRAALLQPRSAVALFGWLPWLGAMLRSSRLATFAEVLALLVENRVPLHEAVLLAARSAGDARMIRAAEEIAGGLERGQAFDRLGGWGARFSPLLDWLMITGQKRGALLPALHHAAEIFHRRARRHADAARLFVPIVLSLVIGGAVTLFYALLLFVPWTQALRSMSGM